LFRWLALLFLFLMYPVAGLRLRADFLKDET